MIQCWKWEGRDRLYWAWSWLRAGGNRGISEMLAQQKTSITYVEAGVNLWKETRALARMRMREGAKGKA